MLELALIEMAGRHDHLALALANALLELANIAGLAVGEHLRDLAVRQIVVPLSIHG